jgi:hypothetical protein
MLDLLQLAKCIDFSLSQNAVSEKAISSVSWRHAGTQKPPEATCPKGPAKS